MRNSRVGSDQQLGAFEQMPHLRERQIAAKTRKCSAGIDCVEQLRLARPSAEHDAQIQRFQSPRELGPSVCRPPLERTARAERGLGWRGPVGHAIARRCWAVDQTGREIGPSRRHTGIAAQLIDRPVLVTRIATREAHHPACTKCARQPRISIITRDERKVERSLGAQTLERAHVTWIVGQSANAIGTHRVEPAVRRGTGHDDIRGRPALAAFRQERRQHDCVAE